MPRGPASPSPPGVFQTSLPETDPQPITSSGGLFSEVSASWGLGSDLWAQSLAAAPLSILGCRAWLPLG